MSDERDDGADEGRENLRDLGVYIREQRKKAEMSLRDMAERAGISNPYLSQLERGLHEPSVRVLKAIAGALNVSGEVLLMQAGLLDDLATEGPGSAFDEEPAPPCTVEAAVEADAALSPAQKQGLLTVYRSYLSTPQDEPAT